jgi:hypothetical protein
MVYMSNIDDNGLKVIYDTSGQEYFYVWIIRLRVCRMLIVEIKSTRGQFNNFVGCFFFNRFFTFEIQVTPM